MTLKKIILFTISILTLVFILNSCTKEEITNENDPNIGQKVEYRQEIDPMTTNTVTVENNMLSFDSYETFIKIYNALKEKSADTQFYRLVYDELGYNTLGENGEEYHEPENVVLEKFENRFSYNSLRKVEDNSFIEFLNEGNDPKDFNGSFVLDGTFRSLLNEKYEVKIGNYYFKYINSDNLAVVSDGDFSKIENLYGKSIFEIEDELNLHVFNISDPSIPDITNKNTDDLGIRFVFFCIVRFKTTKIGENTYGFKNISFIPWFCNFKGNVQFNWDFGDGTTFVGKNPPAHTYSPNGYPYTVTLKTTGTNCCNKTFSRVIQQECDVDFEIKFWNEFKDGNSLGNVVYFKAHPTTNDYNYHWDFGDGNTYNGTSNTDFGWVVHGYDVSADDNYDVTLTVTAKDGSCSRTITKNIFVGCGHVYAVHSKQKNFTANSRTWRLAANIFCKNNLLFETVGANSKSFRKWGIWWRKDADKLQVDFFGDFINVIETVDYIDINGIQHQGGDPICSQQDIDESKIKSNVKKVEILAEDIQEVKKPRFYDNHLKSHHYIKKGGKTVTIDLSLRN